MDNNAIMFCTNPNLKRSGISEQAATLTLDIIVESQICAEYLQSSTIIYLERD